ncbi:hypothetical protein QZH41_004580 [Actinostola sp. cb2023]|nr:hypothetical protein QZH41_004580 [Actinostola sp. cb2023]
MLFQVQLLFSYNCSPSTSSSSIVSSSSTPRSTESAVEQETPRAKKTYDKWTQNQQQLLVSLRAEKHEDIESKDSRKAWIAITKQINEKLKIQRTTDKYQNKMKYLIDRCKIAKDWTSKQTGGLKRKSPFYHEINEVLECRDIVTLRHVADVGTSASHSDSEESPTRKRKSRKKEKQKEEKG